MDEQKAPLVIIAGPTAVGKSDAAVALAKKINGAVISADSMQVYRGMDIGTAKITPEEMQGVPHYLIDILDPDEPFHVVRFQELAQNAIREITTAGKIPILCGGTGFYIQALLYGIDFTETSTDPVLREELENLAKNKGSEALHAMLETMDPDAAAKIHPHNIKRQIRAIEFYRLSGQRISETNEKERQKPPAYHAAYFCLTMDRKRLYERIDARVDQMMEKGLLQEVTRLKEKGYQRDLVSMQGLGYKEILQYLDGECSLSEAVYKIKRDSRHFAKRQLTWMNREKDILWVPREAYPETKDVTSFLCRKLREKEIIG
ncbi:MAG: tRNA (adenosine(37)-N6)-dimethylallyltransferase MiaA [Lachnospiraceae bacterium]|nr:tRNA (adenosine(37)-N6)-dimethylallyltransferase MiaA [Lachnospiraceae bacterium]